jgi:hypothetical protein
MFKNNEPWGTSDLKERLLNEQFRIFYSEEHPDVRRLHSAVRITR